MGEEAYEVMITTDETVVDSRVTYLLGPRIIPQAEALKEIKGFFRWGGRVTDLQPTEIIVETRPWNGHDVHTFEGTAEAMQPLFLEAEKAPRIVLAVSSPAHN